MRSNIACISNVLEHPKQFAVLARNTCEFGSSGTEHISIHIAYIVHISCKGVMRVSLTRYSYVEPWFCGFLISLTYRSWINAKVKPPPLNTWAGGVCLQSLTLTRDKALKLDCVTLVSSEYGLKVTFSFILKLDPDFFYIWKGGLFTLKISD